MNVRIAPRTIPAGESSRVAVFTQATEPGRVALALSIQREAIGSLGIIRNSGPPYAIGQGPDGPTRIEDAAAQRAGFLPVVDPGDSHLVRFERRRPDRIPVAVTGCGNLLCNRGVQARSMSDRAGVAGFMRAGILVGEDARGRLLVLNELNEKLSSAKSFPNDRFLITGPLLVLAGKAVEPDVGEYADLRHLLLPAWVEVRPGRRVDFGFDYLNQNRAQAQAAVAGKPVRLPLRERIPKSAAVNAELEPLPVDPGALREALEKKGYRAAAEATEPGTFHEGADDITIAFLPGIYPHHALAVGEDGIVTSLIVTGRSNREGATIRDLAAALADAGAKDAILLDNGGDVGLLRRGEPSAESPLEWTARPAETDRASAWPLRACLIYHAGRKT